MIGNAAARLDAALRTQRHRPAGKNPLGVSATIYSNIR